MKKGVIDILEEGKGKEKFVALEVNGKRIGSIHLGSRNDPGNPDRVIVNLQPMLYGSGYSIFESTGEDKQFKYARKRENVLLTLEIEK